ncbi:dimethylsulfonioproprionate lyase family protein [Actinomycetospora lemnae]|uniref:Dimethylsulfonioproprionate lyase family protein n=1 Tax=Actinomycetospora lemnae TaxID=3019891 RepID=A0ABT5SXI7_9PSEU|nr:dimethylsulfonioproprionate lyase family protein [Actinomycetospora sp. DW7H6]MDD7967570.1 dimethylsulfonioproprionate lyase family protein [Actinomycetospora sp. DW7H6]
MTPGSEPLAVLVGRLRAALVDRGYAGQAGALDGVLSGAAPAGTAGGDLPVLAHLDDAVARAGEEVDGELAAVLGSVAASARWTQTASYVREPPGPGFLDGYAHATLVSGDDVAVGLLLLGPQVHYPPHHHPAEEFYLPGATIRWLHGAGPAGVLVHHAPWQPHAMTTGDRPALLAYVWTGDVATPSAFC